MQVVWIHPMTSGPLNDDVESLPVFRFQLLNEDGKYDVINLDGNVVATYKSARDAQDHVETHGKILDHLKRTYPEHLREPLMGRTDAGPDVSGGSYGGPAKPDRKKRIATQDYFYEHGAKDFSGYLSSYTQASHAALNKKAPSLTKEPSE